MAKELVIAIEIAQTGRAKILEGMTNDVKGINILHWSTGTAEMGKSTGKTTPDIIIIDEIPENNGFLTRVKMIKEHFPQAKLIVVSENKNHQHIISVMKAGAAEYLVEPISDDLLYDAIEEVRAKLANSGRLAHGRIYSFIGAKGGVGSTALAVNTSGVLAKDKKSSVALMDMSFQSGDASVLLDIVPQNTIMDICENMSRLDVSFLRGILSEHSTGINFLPAPANPEDSEEILSEHISSILNLSRKLHDHIVLDCGSMHINDCSVEAFKQSDMVFVVTDMSVPSIRNTVRLCTLIKKFGIGLDKIEVVINRYIKGGTLSLGEIEKNFDKPVYWLAPNDFAEIVASINRGVPVVKLSPGALFSKNMVEFIKKIKGISDDSNFRGIKSTFGKNI
jgi:pilus assembly protein CpaE